MRYVIGDLFAFKSSKGTGYFQYLGDDSTQLNGNIIRVFKGLYSETAVVNITMLEAAGVKYFALVFIKFGIKLKYWSKFAKEKPIDLPNIWFRDTDDYGVKLGEEPIKATNNWYVWQPSDQKKRVYGLRGEHAASYLGIVISPNSLAERAETGKFQFVHPEPIICEP